MSKSIENYELSIAQGKEQGDDSFVADHEHAAEKLTKAVESLNDHPDFDAEIKLDWTHTESWSPEHSDAARVGGD